MVNLNWSSCVIGHVTNGVVVMIVVSLFVLFCFVLLINELLRDGNEKYRMHLTNYKLQ